jgi:hypothetical protein
MGANGSSRMQHLRLRSLRGLVIQILGVTVLGAAAVTFAVHGEWAAASVFGFLTLFPLGGLLAWGYVYKSAATRPKS